MNNRDDLACGCIYEFNETSTTTGLCEKRLQLKMCAVHREERLREKASYLYREQQRKLQAAERMEEAIKRKNRKATPLGAAEVAVEDAEREFEAAEREFEAAERKLIAARAKHDALKSSTTE